MGESKPVGLNRVVKIG